MITIFIRSELARDPWAVIHWTGLADWRNDRPAGRSGSLRPGMMFATLAARHISLIAHLEQVAHLLRQAAEPVDKLGGKAVEIALRRDIGQPAVDAEPHPCRSGMKAPGIGRRHPME
jgi:hypothetical protein